jgi:DNA-directed RNA polymerase specialized sigma24 family protein
MMDNPRPDWLRHPLMPVIGGRAGQAHGAPQPTSAPSPHSTVVTDEAAFLAALPVIDDVTGQVCRRHRLNAAETDEFRSDVRLHFIERNYEVLRQFEGRCALATYVNVVVQRVFFDWRNRMWGRWRPSTQAKRLGPTAILIERLMVRDGWTRDQTVEMLRVNHRVELDPALREFCDTLIARMPARRAVLEEEAAEVAGPGPAPDSNLVVAERDFLAKRVQAALERARQGLPPIDRLILKMRFEDRAAVADIARVLHLEQRPLYRTIERLLKAVGAGLEAEGISRADIDALFAAPAIEWMESGRDADPATQDTTTGLQDRKGATWRTH